MNITFIGGGNMAAALIGGMTRSGFAATEISVVEPFAASREKLAGDFGVAVYPAAAAFLAAADLIVMAVKPQNMREAAQSLAPYLSKQTVLSIAAGTRLTDLSRWLGGHAKLIRCMPNTPALIGKGVTGMFASGVDAAEREGAERVMRAVGSVVWVASEALLDPVTAVSGSGPAYVFYFLEAMQEAGVKLGLPPEVVKQLALDTFQGAAQLAATSPDDFATLRAKVTSKGGTTEAALKVMQEREIKAAIVAALDAASSRGRELGELLGKD